MPLEDLTGPSKFVNALNPLNPDGATDTVDEADNHMRGIKNVLKNTLPNIVEAILATAAQINSWEVRIAAREAPGLQPDALFPLGTVHFTTDSTNPGLYLPGTWTQIAQGRTLIGEGTGAGLTARVAGNILGAEDQAIIEHSHDVVDPQHRHDMPSGVNGSGSGGYDDANNDGSGTPRTNLASTGITVGAVDAAPAETVLPSGVGLNMQPSLVVYIWERTA